MKKEHISEEQLWEYLDGEINQEKQGFLEKHLDKCPLCKKAYLEIAAFNQELAGAVQLQPSMRFSKNVMEIIEIEVSKKLYRPLLQSFWRKLAISGFATMLTAMVAVGFLFPGEENLPFQIELTNLQSILGFFPQLFQNQIFMFALLSVAGLWGIYLLDKFVIARFIRK